MRWTTAAASALILCCCLGGPSPAAPPLDNPAFLNIGLGCRWDDRCMTAQSKAMTRALAYVRHAQPSAWRVQLCNRNAKRGYNRVDWIGFDHCIRNQQLSRAVANDARRRAHH